MPESVKPAAPPPFDLAVPQDGYRWWYLDAISDDGRYGLVIIAFVGSVFSPYYYRARQRGAGEPENFCAINVALYGPKGRWCMTERGRGDLQRDADTFIVGPSRLAWDGAQLTYTLQERCTPFGQALRGRINVTPGPACGLSVPLDALGAHRWTPWAPHSRVEVDMKAPNLRWSGPAYLDANAGDEPLEQAFHGWDWSRTDDGEGMTLHYDVDCREGARRLFSYRVERDGSCREVPAAGPVVQPGTAWRLPRAPRADHPIASVRGFEDTPFYSRSVFEGAPGAPHTVHEHLDLDRFRSSWVRLLLPFRMPRKTA